MQDDDQVDTDLPVARFEEEGSSYELVLPQANRDHIQRTLFDTKKPYELLMLQDMARKLTPGDLVLDVGANVGNHTIYLARIAKARVHAFEPNPALFTALEQSVRRNGLQDLVTLYPIGVSDRTAKAFFPHALPDNLGAQSLKLGEGEIEVASIDSLGLELSVRMLKVDVEGMEDQVLRGASKTIARDRPLIYVECRDEAEFRGIADWAQAAGYSYWETFNVTPTHLFLPTEILDIDQRLEHLNAKKVLQDYRYVAQLQRKRETIVQVRAEIAALKSRLTAQVDKADKLAEKLSGQEKTITLLELEKNQLVVHYERIVTTARNRLARAQDEISELHRYGSQLEMKYREVLESETWRAMEPVRQVIRIVKRKPAPRPFEPRLNNTPVDFSGGKKVSRPTTLVRCPDADKPRSQKVVIFLATYPARRYNLPRTVAALLPQCDVLQVYLNEYEEIPSFLNDEKISAILGKDAAGDIKDNGKFFGTLQYMDCYHIFADDDILYPPDYVEKITTAIKGFGYRAIVGCHGTIYNEPLQSYLRDRKVLRFYSGSRNTIVDQLGTGTAGYHTSTFTIDTNAFESEGIADLWFAKRAAECGVPLLALSRPDDWLLPMPENGETIFAQMQRDNERQSALLRDKLVPALRRGPRGPTARFLASLYTPTHLERHKFNLDASRSGAFGPAPDERSDIHFALIITGWNCGGYLPKCLASIERQVIGGYTLDIYAYDDCSSDSTFGELLQHSKRLRMKYFRGETNMGPAFARDFLIREIEDEQTICVLLDMDDELLPEALTTLERTYRKKPDCWMTYGNWVNQNGLVNDQGTYSPAEIDDRAYRKQDVFKFTHLRSFRRFLYNKIVPAQLKDEEGNWLRFCSDVGIMLPLADQCASENVVAFQEPLYLYNQYRPTGTQKRFRGKKKETFLYLRDNAWT